MSSLSVVFGRQIVGGSLSRSECRRSLAHVVFGKAGFVGPGGTMNVYLGGVIGFAWIAGVDRWARQRLDSAGRAEGNRVEQ